MNDSCVCVWKTYRFLMVRITNNFFTLLYNDLYGICPISQPSLLFLITLNAIKTIFHVSSFQFKQLPYGNFHNKYFLYFSVPWLRLCTSSSKCICYIMINKKSVWRKTFWILLSYNKLLKSTTITLTLFLPLVCVPFDGHTNIPIDHASTIICPNLKPVLQRKDISIPCDSWNMITS